jgi:pimeloyl-[acyl-carrier protein] methyl ester esterase
MARAAVAGAQATQLHVEVTGTGAPLVLLHGFALHGGVFGPLVERLAEHRRVIVVDLPGHGHSARVPVSTLENAAAAVAATLHVPDAGGGDDALDVLGWSFGGQVALALAQAHPARVRRLVLACTTPSFVAREGFDGAMDEATLRRFGDELRVAYRLTLQRFLTLQVQGGTAAHAILAALRTALFARGQPSAEALAATLALLVGTDLRAAVPLVRAPALVLAGPRDTLVPLAASEWLAAHLPDARLQVIDGAAHAPFLSHPDAFATAVERFLS